MPEANIYIGNVLKRLSEIPEGSVRTVVTSPPYYGLRDYGTGDWLGGDPTCSHKRDSKHSDFTITGHKNPLLTVGDAIYKSVCPRCGAVREDEQLGLEETPEAYIEQMVAVFREVWRVLSDDGTLWLNIGDSYAGGGGGNYNKTGVLQAGGQHVTNVRNKPDWLENAGIKPKDMMGIPWMLAFALRADGWYLRQDIIWAKPNPMPESVTDRCTKSHEYVFLLSKNKHYFYDHIAIKEPAVYAGDDRGSRGAPRRGTAMNLMSGVTGETKNKRDVWTIATKPFKEAHFAVMPEALVEPSVLAGTSEKGKCSECGNPWVRVVESKRLGRSELDPSDPRYLPAEYVGDYAANTNRRSVAGYNSTETMGWEPTCQCDAEIVPDVVLDPFTGSGTVAVVALRHGRNFVGTELNPEYAEIARNRIADSAPMFNVVNLV